MEMQNNFATSDFWLAATLMALGEQLIDVDRSGGGVRAEFVFVFSASLERGIEGYKRGTLRLEPQNLYVQTKLLKNRLHSNY